MTTLFLDTEFNGFGGELLSMALVSDEGHEFYQVVETDKPFNAWVAEHVVPKFGRPAVRPELFRTRLHGFLRLFKDPLIVADWHADFAHFFDAFHGEDYTKSLDYSCRTRLLSGKSDIKPANPHNALSDAIALRDWYMRRT